MLIKLKRYKTGVTLLFLLGLVYFFAINTKLTISTSYFLAVAYCIVFRDEFRLTYRSVGVHAALIFLLMLPSLTLNFGLTPVFYLIFSPAIYFSARIICNIEINELAGIIKKVYFTLLSIVIFLVLRKEEYIAPFEGLIEGSSTNAIPSYAVVIQVT